jgi:hypothetical protein
MDDNVSEIPSEEVFKKVLKDAITNAIWFAIGTFIIIEVGSSSRTVGLILAAIETLFAVWQSLKVTFLIVTTLVIDVATLLGKYRPHEDQAPMRWSLLIRIVELGIWIGCILILYRFFFR